jgi:dTDP-4-dehydrorhamnose reductase
MPKLLVTGGSGMLGSYVASQAASTGWETVVTYSTHAPDLPSCEKISLDIREIEAAEKALADLRPDVVIHTAAIAKPNICEERKMDAFQTNVLGTYNMVRAAEKVSAHFIQISTDMVFSGEKNPLRTDDQIAPPNYYGLTKAAAEAAVNASSTSTAIVRTSVIYGPRKFPHLDSFSDKVIENLRNGQPMQAYIDQTRPAVPAWNLAEVLLEIAERRLTGTFHAVCPEPSTRLQFAKRIAREFGFDESLLSPIYMDETTSNAGRPKILVLDTISTQRALNTRLLGFEEGIRALKERMKKG